MFRNLLTITILSIILFAYNNCYYGDGPFPVASMSGGGEPYDGKPEAGTYYRQIYGISCNSSDIMAQLSVTEDKVELIKRTLLNCYETTSTLVFEQLEYYRNFKEVIGFEGGIYINSENYEKGFVPELWCHSEEISNQRHHLFLYNPETKELKTKWVIGENEYQNPSTTRSVSSKSAVYENSSFKLNVDLSTEVVKGQKNYAAEVFDKTTNLKTNLSCISGSNTLPENKVYDISKELYEFNKLFYLFGNAFSKSQRYFMNKRVSSHDVGTNFVFVFDLNLARIAYTYKDLKDDGQVLKQAAFSKDEKYLYFLEPSYLTEANVKPVPRVRIINIEDKSEKIIETGEYQPFKLLFENDTYIGISAKVNVNFEYNIFEKTDHFVILNKKNNEVTLVDTFPLGFEHDSQFLANDKNLFYYNPVYNSENEMLNYEVVAYDFQSKVKNTINLDGSFKLKLEFLPSTSIPMLFGYANETQSKFILFDEKVESFVELEVDPRVSPVSSLDIKNPSKIVKDPSSNEFYLTAHTYSNYDGVLLKINTDLKTVSLQASLKDLLSFRTSIDFLNKTLLYQSGSGFNYSDRPINLINLKDGSFITSWVGSEVYKIEPQAYNGVHLVHTGVYKEGENYTSFSVVEKGISTVQNNLGQWRKEIEFEGSQSRPLFSENFENSIFTQQDNITGEIQIKLKNLLTQQTNNLMSLNYLDGEFKNMVISPNESFLFISTFPYEKTGRYKFFLIRLPAN